jgi:lipid II:glycine glycyltransferase (peptidoglycan interpeptide bridge formation enzyme)
MQIVRSLDETLWRSFVSRHPLGNIFHTPEMFQVFARAKRHAPLLWATVDRDAQPLALLLPVQITLFPGPLRSVSTRAIVYGSVLYESGPKGTEALETLLESYAQQTKGVLFTEMRNLTDLGGIQPMLQAYGFQYEEQLNYLIPLDLPSEEVLQNIGRRTRKRIRRALRQGELVIKEVERREELTLFYDLVSKSYAAARVPLADVSLFEAAFDLLHPKGMVKFLLAWVGDQCVGASAELAYKDVIFGWYSGVDRSFSSYVPNELLMWYILEWGAENGYRVYDFGGAGRSDEEYGVRDFKAKFGGDLVSYGRNALVHAPRRLAMSKIGYQVYRSLAYLRLPDWGRGQPEAVES